MGNFAGDAVGRAVLRCGFFAAALACCAGAVRAQAGDPAPTELELKAAFIFKFAGYVEWPRHAFADDHAPLVFCVAGDTSLAVELRKTVIGRTINGRDLVARECGRPADVAAAQIAYVAPGTEGTLLRAAEGKPVLLVTEDDGGLENGATINLLRQDRRIRFEVSLAAAEKAGLVVSSRLLAVAVRIRKSDAFPGESLFASLCRYC